MKQFIIFTFCLISINVSSQKSINNLFESIKDDEKTFALKLPGWIIDTGLKYALSETDNQTLNLFKDKINQMRILVNENKEANFNNVISKFKKAATKDHLELYASVKDKENIVNIYVEESKEKVKNLFFLINGDDNTVLLHLKTDILLSDFKNADFTFNKEKKTNNEKN
jgi:hypothetical protein